MDRNTCHTIVTLEDGERQECEIWSRCMGYHRPIDSWNRGKRQEHHDRKFFTEQTSNRLIAAHSEPIESP